MANNKESIAIYENRYGTLWEDDQNIYYMDVPFLTQVRQMLKASDEELSSHRCFSTFFRGQIEAYLNQKVRAPSIEYRYQEFSVGGHVLMGGVNNGQINFPMST